ncbi:hypothetical protein L1049_015021 [Liquidambar formosana]|uniref:Zinc finger LSD1-type domain-containing protein n=1 Tax=Liquidambar formosana TaxID=63359 RepID=A0AAP0S310_LIQFO
MAGRIERCSWCGVQLLVPPEAQTIQCAVCQAVTRVRPNDPLVQPHDSIGQAVSWLKGFMNAVSSNVNSVPTSALSGTAATGALTYSFIQAVQNEPGITYGRLLTAMRSAIREAKTGIRLDGPIASLVRKVFRTELVQVC